MKLHHSFEKAAKSLVLLSLLHTNDRRLHHVRNDSTTESKANYICIKKTACCYLDVSTHPTKKSPNHVMHMVMQNVSVEITKT